MTKRVVNPDNAQADRAVPAGRPPGITVFPDGVSANYEEAAATALAAALTTLDVRPEERVLIVMPDESGFEEAIIGTIQLAAVPLPVNPSVSADDLVTVATEAGARLAVVSSSRTEALDVPTEQVVPVDGPRGTWASVLLLG